MSNQNGFGASLMTFLSGVVIGGGLALLFAPQSGKETRKQIKDVAEKTADEVRGRTEKIAQSARNVVKHAKSYVSGSKEGLQDE